MTPDELTATGMRPVGTMDAKNVPERHRAGADSGRQTYIRGIGTATPSARYTKLDCLQAFQDSAWYEKIDARARFVLHNVLKRENGMDERRLVVDSLAEAFAIDPDTLAARFLAHAPKLAADAGRRALVNAGLDASSIDAVVVSTCTGYLCPGLSGYVVQGLGLRADVLAFDLVGQGCAAALPNLQLGHTLLRSGRCENVLSVCVEICSAAMYLDNDPGVIISACLFGDGAGAAVLSSQPAEPASGADADTTLPRAPRLRWVDSASLIEPAHRDALRFESRHGLLRNILTRQVPALAATYAARVLDTVLQRSGLQQSDISEWMMHAGGRDVLLALEQKLGLDGKAFRYSAAMLRQYGNLSSAFVYFVMEAALADCADGAAGASSKAGGGGDDGQSAPGREWWWLSSFGAGFSCHGALLEVER